MRWKKRFTHLFPIEKVDEMRHGSGRRKNMRLRLGRLHRHTVHRRDRIPPALRSHYKNTSKFPPLPFQLYNSVLSFNTRYYATTYGAPYGWRSQRRPKRQWNAAKSRCVKCNFGRTTYDTKCDCKRKVFNNDWAVQSLTKTARGVLAALVAFRLFHVFAATAQHCTTMALHHHGASTWRRRRWFNASWRAVGRNLVGCFFAAPPTQYNAPSRSVQLHHRAGQESAGFNDKKKNRPCSANLTSCHAGVPQQNDHLPIHTKPDILIMRYRVAAMVVGVHRSAHRKVSTTRVAFPAWRA